MNNKESILKRLLEEKHITIEEMFILNESKVINTINMEVFSKPYETHLPYITQNPYWIICNYSLSKDNTHSDYKMD